MGLAGTGTAQPLVIAVTETAGDILAGDILFLFLRTVAGLFVLAEYTLALFLLRIVVTRFIIENPVLGITEEIEVESHTFRTRAYTRELQSYTFLFIFVKIKDMADIRIGQGYDVHAIAPGLPMWLCGIRIPSDMGFVAHSDGDVAIHALCDALLGALALGDIGKLFPDSDDAYKGIDSKILLARVMEMVKGPGWHVVNVDITIALQSPKLRPHIDGMRDCLASILGCPVENVSVKATTTERLGFVGREEGCAVWAVCIIGK